MSVVVVGAGPAGVRAVERLVEAGIRPIWIEESPDGGGRVFQKPPPGFSRDAKALYGADAARAQAIHDTVARLRAQVDWRPGTLVWNLRPGPRLLNTQGPDGVKQEVPYERVILCTGAMDRALPIPGWTKPGVTGLGAAQIALKAQGLAIGRRVALCGTGPLLLLLAWQLTKAGAPPALVLESAGWGQTLRAAPGLAWNPMAALRGLAWRAALRRRGVRIHTGALPLRVEGADSAQALLWRDAKGAEHRTEVDGVAIGYGLKPETQLADLAGVPFAFDTLQRLWLPERDRAGRTAVPGVYLAGDGASIGGSVVAELAGTRAALAVIEDAGQPVDPLETDMIHRRLWLEARFRAALERAFPYPAAHAAAMPDETLLCRCEAITAGDLRATDAPEVNRGKAFTRIGMGRCQGRVCGPAGAEVLAAARGCAVQDVGRLRGQMPVKPVVMA